jgi:parvulin-like peptidyl-prolyl isomerase
VKIVKILSATLLTLLLSAIVYAEVADRIVAVVNDDIITQTELNRAFEPYAKNIDATYKGPDRDTVIQQNKEAFLQQMVNQILIEQAAKKAGPGIATVKDEEVMDVIRDMLAKSKTSLEDYTKRLAEEGNSLDAVKKEIKSQMLRMRLLRREVQSKIMITDEEIGAYYDKHREDYEGKEAVRIKQIFLTAPADAGRLTRQRVKQQVEELRNRIVKGESFDAISAQYSQGPAAAQGGDIGYVEKGVILPEVEKAAFALPPGKLSDVIETELGYHLILVVDQRGAGLKPLSIVRNEIKAKIEEEKLAKKFEEWIEELRKKSFIDIRL